ncbi:MAG TPA: hypothetical protein VFI28_03490 [Candidatus Limnocylindrales bacterium]|nr:hypothetical protein [Candidatus Limnocylindrales bacterium]
MRFQDAARDGRAVVYANVQADPLVRDLAAALVDASAADRILARAAMNGESEDPAAWRTMFPSLFGEDVEPADRARAETILALSLAVGGRGDQVRSQLRGAIVEELTQRLLARRTGAVRRERRILFDGVAAEIHPYDVTVEVEGAAEAYDCKWGARGIGDEVLLQLDAARSNAAAEGIDVAVGLVVFDAARSCAVRLMRLTTPRRRTRIVPIENLDALARPSARR